MIPKGLNGTWVTSIVIEVIRTVSIFFFFHERYFKCKKHKQKHLRNIQPDISKQTKKHLSNIQPDISKQKKHLSNIQPNISKQKKQNT